MDGHLHVEVDADVLNDLCALIDDLAEHGYLDDAPPPLVNGIRGAAAELRCHSLATA